MKTWPGRAHARLVGAGLLGVAVGLAGTVVHRWSVPFGILLALLTVLVGGILTRAWAGWAGMLALGLGLVTTVGILGGPGPGGDVLIAAQPVGYVWYGSAVLIAVAGLAPARWFSDRPLGGRQHVGTTGHVQGTDGT